MARPVIKVEGIKQLEKAFKKLPKTFRNRVLRNSLKRSARPVLRSAKSNVPHEFNSGGVLRKSLIIRTVMGRVSKDMGVRIKVGPRNKLNIDPKDKHFYPAAIEWGAKPHDIPNAFGRPGMVVRHPGNKPYAFMRRAMNSNERKVVSNLSREIAIELPKQWAKAVAKGKL